MLPFHPFSFSEQVLKDKRPRFGKKSYSSPRVMGKRGVYLNKNNRKFKISFPPDAMLNSVLSAWRTYGRRQAYKKAGGWQFIVNPSIF